MLKDSFFGLGKISKSLNIIIISLIIIMYLSIFFDQFSVHSFWYNNYLSFSFVLFLVFIVNLFWKCFNQKPMSLAMTKAGSFALSLNRLLIYIILLAIIIISFWEYVFDSYCQYLISVHNKMDYKVFNFTLVPFSVIQLICYVLETYMHFNIISLRTLFHKWWLILFMGVLPSLLIIYGLQIIINRMLYKKTSPDTLS